MKYITRKKISNNKYNYFDEKNQKVLNTNILNKISKIYIPPAYKNVRIFPNSEDLLAYGYDDAGRKQYIYSQKFKEKREAKKYCKLIHLGNTIQKFHKKVDQDLKDSYFTHNKVIAIIFRIIELCNFRGGTRKLEKKHGSYGITTIHKNHVKFSNKNSVEFEFIGKKQVENKCRLNQPEYVELIRKIYTMSDSSPYLFELVNEKKENIQITLSDLNEYLLPFKITVKDIRTWNANIIFLKNMKKQILIFNEKYEKIKHKKGLTNEQRQDKEMKMRKKVIREAIKTTAQSLHHTPAICKASYLFKNLLEVLTDKNTYYNKIKNNKDSNIENDLLKILQDLGNNNVCK